MLPINKDFLLGVGAEYNPFNSQSGNYNYGVGSAKVNGTYQSQNQYNIFLSPATPVGKDGLLYGKVGYTGASIKASDGGASNTQNYTGYSLGLGYKQIISGGLYGFGELNYLSYNNKTNSYSGSVGGTAYSYSMTSSANVFNAVLGVGYKF
jgi:outer membrane immunogenic protein